MSPSRWRALRALRVVLACLALWLPARVANASLGPIEAVVMIASAPGVEAPAGADREERASQRADGTSAHGLSADTDRPEETSPGPSQNERRIAPTPLYLLHCALLR